MDRAERRSRTELIRARRTSLYNQIDEWRLFRTTEARERWYHIHCQSQYLPDTWAAEAMRRDLERDAARNGEMRNEYVVGYRDDCYWWCGVMNCRDSADTDFRDGLEEVGMPHFFRAWRESHHYL